MIDELLEDDGFGEEYSEDSEEDEDSETATDPKWVLYWKIRNFEIVDGIALCDPFMDLPNRRLVSVTEF